MSDNLLESLGEAIENYAGETVDKFYVDPAFGIHRLLEYKREHLWIVYHDEYPAWLVTSIDRPKMNSGSTKKIKYINTHEKLAQGHGEWKPISITFHEAIVPNIAYTIYTQLRKQWEYNTATVGYKDDYVIKNFQLRMLDPNGIVVETWILHDAFITGDVDFGKLSYDSLSRVKSTITLDYSWAEFILGGTP